MGTIPSYDPAPTPLQDSDQFYLERGSGVDRGKRVDLGTVAEYMSTASRAIYTVSGSGSQTFDTDDKPSGIVIVSGTVTGLVLGGSGPTLKSQFTILNWTAGPVGVTSTSGFIVVGGIAASPVTLQYPGDVLIVTRAENPPYADIWAGQHIVGAAGFAALQTFEEYATGLSPEFNWSSSGAELDTGSVTLEPGTWVLNATVLVRGQSGSGAILNAETRWQDIYSSAPALVGGAGATNSTVAVSLCSVHMPQRRVTIATNTTFTLKTTARYSGGSGNADAWVSISAQRVA